FECCARAGDNFEEQCVCSSLLSLSHHLQQVKLALTLVVVTNKKTSHTSCGWRRRQTSAPTVLTRSPVWVFDFRADLVGNTCGFWLDVRRWASTKSLPNGRRRFPFTA